MNMRDLDLRALRLIARPSDDEQDEIERNWEAEAQEATHVSPDAGQQRHYQCDEEDYNSYDGPDEIDPESEDEDDAVTCDACRRWGTMCRERRTPGVRASPGCWKQAGLASKEYSIWLKSLFRKRSRRLSIVTSIRSVVTRNVHATTRMPMRRIWNRR